MSDPADDLEVLFHELVGSSARDRARRLASRHMDAAAARELTSLLEHDEAAGTDFLERTDLPHAASCEIECGMSIGRYRILERIGAGSCGVVYAAEQTEPIRRHVALKVIRPGMDTDELLGRFEAERDALSMMDHDNVVTMLDAGATPCGRPFVVMELFAGIPLLRFCAEHELDLDARLRLFVRVCRGVQHAHDRGILHRDIKPSNILVAMNGAEPQPKIIDFGLARALSRRADETHCTRCGEIVGTPEYMSPEQTSAGGEPIDARTDVYSLGALLYEFATGRRALASEIRAAGLDGFRGVVREVTPPRPSSLMGSGRPTRAGTARRRLDRIVMKAMEKEPRRRYASAAALGRDVEHYLAGDAVSAAGPSVRYRAVGFARRHAAALDLVCRAGLAWLVCAALLHAVRIELAFAVLPALIFVLSGVTWLACRSAAPMRTAILAGAATAMTIIWSLIV